jgi:rod shape-determining protein MreB
MQNISTRLPVSGDIDVSIDLGTANTLVVNRSDGLVFNEPSICCFSGIGAKTKLFAAGDAAHEMRGRTTRPLRLAKPLKGGVLSDIDAGRELLRYAIKKSRSRWGLRRLRAIIGIPSDATEAEQRALITAGQDAGLGRVQLVAEPLLAAIGAGLDIDEPRGRMVVDCGAGTTEVVVISLGGVCLAKTIRIGGDTLEEALGDHFLHKHRFKVGISEAERVKYELAALEDFGVEVSVRGQSLSSGLPCELRVPAVELAATYEKHVESIVDTIKNTLNHTPPELSRDILDDGITLTGGSALMGILGKRITEATAIKTIIAEEPLNNVANGLKHLMEVKLAA